MTETSPRLSRQELFFLTLLGLGVTGTVFGQLGSTSAALRAGGENGSVFTGLFLSIFLLASALSAPWAGALAARLGDRQAFAHVLLATALAWAVLGLFVTALPSDIVPLLAAAPILGALSGIGLVLGTVAAPGYLGGMQVAAAVARRSVSAGIAGAVGGIIGGRIIDQSDAGLGIILNGLLTLPLALFIYREKPQAQGLAPEKQQRHSLKAAWADVRSSWLLLRTVALGVMVALFLAPMVSMIVPITNDLEHDSVATAAGTVLAGMAIGRMFVPWITDRLSVGRSHLATALICYGSIAALMVLFAATTWVVAASAQLLLWGIIGVGFGAARYSGRAMCFGVSATSLGKGHVRAGVVALVAIGGLTAPIGTLLWGILIQHLSAAITILFGAVGILLVVGWIALELRARPKPSTADAT